MMHTEHRILAFAETALHEVKDRRYTPPANYFSSLWNENHYRLKTWRHWHKLDAHTRNAIISACNRDTLVEMFHIERLGMSYAGKMVNEAQSLEERMFYCAMAAEEARHFSYVSKSFEKNLPQGEEKMPFVDFLSSMLDEATPTLLIFIIQVVLEGWGLEHYRGLLRTCQDPRMKQVLKTIIQDEARHHGCGLYSFAQRKVHKDELALALPLLRNFLDMVRSGPQMLLNRVSEGVDGLDLQERIHFIQDVKGEAHAKAKLEILRSLIGKDGRTAPLMESLTEHKVWSPLSAELCAEVSLA